MSDNQTSYRQIFKATSLFGGVQVFTIIIGIIRTKFVAVLLGTTGVGIMGLLNSPLQLILSVTGLGITFSAVREISEAHGSGNSEKLARSVKTLRRWSWIAGLLGFIVTLILSPLLSKLTFGNQEYTWAFVWLSITLLMQTISNGQKTIIQSTRRLKDLAKSTVFGSLTGLFTAIPLFYYFGLKGIVPSFIIAAFTALVLTWYFSKKIIPVKVVMSWRESFSEGKSMVKLGLIITVTGIIGNLTAYVLNAFISRTGGVDQVGLFNAAWSIIGQSTGLVFAAMTTDYFPRLSSVNQDDNKINNLVNQQAEMVMLILAPMLTILIVAMPVIIRILYVPAFLPVVDFANWMLLGIVLKGLVWPVGFIFLAKGDLKAFGIIEITGLSFDITTNILGYHFFGLTGLGVSFILNYLFGLGLTLYFAHRKYRFKYNKLTMLIFGFAMGLTTLVFITSNFTQGVYRYLVGGVLVLVTFVYAYRELNKRLDLSNAIRTLLKSKRK